MALINCKECGKKISADATKCPNCGAKLKTNPLAIIFIIILIIIILYFVWNGISI